MLSSSVSHPAAVLVKVDELLSLLPVELHNFEVFVEKHISNFFWVHFHNIYKLRLLILKYKLTIM